MHKNAPAVRCAIYTRTSTEEGLEQEFKSLHAQRQAAEPYIVSQKHLGWTLVPTHYDDGGFTGGNLDRPALQRLLEDIDAHEIRTGGYDRIFGCRSASNGVARQRYARATKCSWSAVAIL
jgi:Resolvase, N terminal domain